MIKVTVYQNTDGKKIGFSSVGHAGYDEYGHDIVCAGVSALVINCINSIDNFCDVRFTVDADDEGGNIKFMLADPADGDSELLINSMILGLKGIQNDYGNDYIILNFKEV